MMIELHIRIELTENQKAHKIEFNTQLIKKLRRARIKHFRAFLKSGSIVCMNRVFKCEELINELQEEINMLN